MDPNSLAYWDERYQTGRTPWDTGIVPPEVVSLVESGQLTPGWALDLGCGTGLSSRYLVQHGFRVIGIDLAPTALKRARAAGEAESPRPHFLLATVTDLPVASESVTFALDVGCLHSIPVNVRALHVRSLARCLAPGAVYLLYAIGSQVPPHASRPGFDPPELEMFSSDFRLIETEVGAYRGQQSAWYRMVRI